MRSFPDVQFQTGDEADSLVCRIIRSSVDQPPTLNDKIMHFLTIQLLNFGATWLLVTFRLEQG